MNKPLGAKIGPASSVNRLTPFRTQKGYKRRRGLWDLVFQATCDRGTAMGHVMHVLAIQGQIGQIVAPK